MPLKTTSTMPRHWHRSGHVAGDQVSWVTVDLAHILKILGDFDSAPMVAVQATASGAAELIDHSQVTGRIRPMTKPRIPYSRRRWRSCCSPVARRGSPAETIVNAFLSDPGPTSPDCVGAPTSSDSSDRRTRRPICSLGSSNDIEHDGGANVDRIDVVAANDALTSMQQIASDLKSKGLKVTGRSAGS
jgi:hypothetical protein